MQNNSNVQIRLCSVNEVRFLMDAGNIGEEINETELKLGFMSRLFPDLESNRLVVHFGVQYSLSGKIILESVYGFEFEIPNLSEFVIPDPKGGITVNGIMPHLISVSVGTMRGILVVKTAGTSLDKFPIPMMDPVQLCDNLAK